VSAPSSAVGALMMRWLDEVDQGVSDCAAGDFEAAATELTLSGEYANDATAALNAWEASVGIGAEDFS
jgi:hypothetical protein